MTTNGADISGWQPENVNLSGLQFCIVKTSEGTDSLSIHKDAQILEVRKANLVLGTYHYAHGFDAIAEAQWYEKNNSRVNGDLQAVDVEGSFFSVVSDPDEWVYAWSNEVYQLTGNKPLVYMNGEALMNVKWPKTVAFNDGLWLAAWNGQNNPGVQQFPVWAIWQYADTSQTGGDADRFNGDVPTLKKYGLNDKVVVPPIIPPVKPPIPPVVPPKPKPPVVPPVIQTFTVYVSPGDTMTSIAQQFNVSLSLLEKVNPQIKDFNTIYVGEAIHIPGHAPSPKKYCVVTAGDTMASIAVQFGVTLLALEEANPQIADFNLIYVGQVIYLP